MDKKSKNNKTIVLNPTREPVYITEVNYSDGAIEKVKIHFIENGKQSSRVVLRLEIVDLLARNIHVRTVYQEPPENALILENLLSAKVIPFPPDPIFITTEGNETKMDNLGELPGIDCETAVQIPTMLDYNSIDYVLGQRCGW